MDCSKERGRVDVKFFFWSDIDVRQKNCEIWMQHAVAYEEAQTLLLGRELYGRNTNQITQIKRLAFKLTVMHHKEPGKQTSKPIHTLLCPL